MFELDGRHYILVVDYYSRFPETVSLTPTSSTAVIAAVKSPFARFGIPDMWSLIMGPNVLRGNLQPLPHATVFTMLRAVPDILKRMGRPNGTINKLFYKTQGSHVARQASGSSFYPSSSSADVFKPEFPSWMKL
ncbi:MAG: hypothetical protein PV344_00740 [Anaplasma sp.]|nr:hypothetical protein [Anaplasma sp.]